MKKLKQFIEREGIMKIHFAAKLGVSPQSLDRYIQGMGMVPPKYWRKICKMTRDEVTIDDFLDEAERNG